MRGESLPSDGSHLHLGGGQEVEEEEHGGEDRHVGLVPEVVLHVEREHHHGGGRPVRGKRRAPPPAAAPYTEQLDG